MSESKKVTVEEDAQVNVIDIIPSYDKSITLKEYLGLKRIETHHQYNEDVSFTNQILFLHNVSEQSQIYYYIPVYARLKLNNILSLDFSKLLATVSVDIKISVYYGQLSEKMKAVLLEKMFLDIPKNLPVHLKDDKTIIIQQKDSQKCFHFLVRNKILTSQVRAHTALSPFEKASINICISMKRINQVYVYNQGEFHLKVKFFFNFMQLHGEQHSQQRFQLPTRKGFGMYKISQKKKIVTVHEQLIHPEDIEQIKKQRIDKIDQKLSNKGEYQEIDQNYGSELDLKSQYKKSNSKHRVKLFKTLFQLFKKKTQKSDENMNKMKPTSIYDQTDDDRVKCFQYISFTTYLYKAPLSTTIFLLVQLLLIGFINVCIFYQDPEQKGKMMLNMATLLVALVALVPGIKEQIGNGGIFTLAEGCVIAQLFTIVLCFAQMIYGIYDKENDSLIFEILCIIITVSIGSVLTLMYLYHKKFAKMNYHGSGKPEWQNLDFDRTKWINEKCDQEFYFYYEGENQHLKILCDCQQLYQTNKYDHHKQIKDSTQNKKIQL